jgi:hypothetical protein
MNLNPGFESLEKVCKNCDETEVIPVFYISFVVE